MQKSLIIGIGGTGLSAIRELRRLIAERYDAGLDDPAMASVRFLYVDTEKNDESARGLNWNVLGKDISLADGEKVKITGDDLGPIIKNIKDYEDYREWLPAVKDFIGDPGPGAKGIRPYGRLIYEYTANKEAVHSACLRAYDELNREFPDVTSWRYYIICSLSGGTGSGMFLTLAQDLINWHLFRRGMAEQLLSGFFVLPPLQISDRHDRYHANAYASLSELNYVAFEPDGLPFSNIYLVEPTNEKDVVIGLNNLPLLIAQRLFLNIQGGAAAGKADAMMDNPNLSEVTAENDPTRRHARKFSTFGLASVSYPREIVAKSLSYQFAAETAAAWIADRDYPKNVNQHVREKLETIRLSQRHLDGDLDPFGKQDYPAYATELRNLIDTKIGALGKKQLGAGAQLVRADIEKTFRVNGIERFYAQRRADVEGAAQRTIAAVRSELSRLVRDPNHGVGFVAIYLDELLKVLADEQTRLTKQTGEAAKEQVNRYRENFSDTVDTTLLHERHLIYTGKEFQLDSAATADTLFSYLKALTGEQAGRYGLELLAIVVPGVEKLRDALGNWKTKISDVRNSLAGALKSSFAGNEKGARENGIVLFTEQILAKISSTLNARFVRAKIEDELRINVKQEELDLFAIGDRPDAAERLFEAAMGLIVGDSSPVDVRNISLYDKFVEEYPDASQRKSYLQKARNLSATFLRTSPEEVARMKIIPSASNVVAIPGGIGKIASDGQDSSATVLRDLVDSGVPEKDILRSADQERIVFLTEKQAFPLRFISSLKDLKQKYDKYPHHEALVVDKRWAPKLYDLFLESAADRTAKNDAEDAFVLARALGWLAVTRNINTGKDEIRFEFEGSLGMEKRVIGNDWELARQAILRDATAPKPEDNQIHETRLLLSQRIQKMDKELQVKAEKREDLTAKLKCYLDERYKEYPDHMDDPRYRRDQEVAHRILERSVS